MSYLKDPFISMCVHAFVGAFVGALGGLIMVCFIGVVGTIISTDSAFSFKEMMGEGVLFFPSMGVGSVVGTILGGIAGLRKTNRN